MPFRLSSLLRRPASRPMAVDTPAPVRPAPVEPDLQQVLAAIDAVNAGDPVCLWDGHEPVPGALLQGFRMTRVLLTLRPGASDAARIAARALRLGVWRHQRSDWPEGRAGTHAWVAARQASRVDTVTGLMVAAGYGLGDCTRVSTLLLRQGGTEGEHQLIEDCEALVTLKWHMAELSCDGGAAELARLVGSLAASMSPGARACATEIDLPRPVAELLAA